MEDPIVFWTRLTAIGQLAAATATFAAVAVSLWITLSARRPNVKLSANMSKLMGAGDADMDVIAFDVINCGQQLVQINSIGWRTGWFRRGPKWFKRQPAIQVAGGLPYGNNPPFELAPGQKGNVIVSLHSFVEADCSERSFQYFRRKLPLMNKYIGANIYATVSLASGKTVMARPSKSLARFLITHEV